MAAPETGDENVDLLYPHWPRLKKLRAQAELRREQDRLAEASKELKVINKLEERQRARYELELQRAELAEADEVAAQFTRRAAARPLVGAAEVGLA